MKKNSLFLIIISIVTLVTLILSSAFAFLASNIMNRNEAEIIAKSVAKVPTFLSTSNGSLALDLSDTDMHIYDPLSTNEYAASANIIVSLYTYANDKVTNCSYDIAYVLSDDSDEYIRTIGAEKEFTIEGRVLELKNAQIIDDTFKEIKYVNTEYELEETNIDELNWNEKAAILIENAHISSANKDIPTIVNYEFKIRFYNVEQNQSKLLSQSYKGHLEVISDSIDCQMEDSDE